MKNSWIGYVLLFFCTPLWAYFDYYAGISAGLDINTQTIEQTSILNVPDIFLSRQTDEFDSNQVNGLGQIQLGAGLHKEIYYLGIELSGQFFDGDYDATETQYNAISPIPVMVHQKNQLHLNDFELGLDLKPGIRLYDYILLYGRVGVGLNRLTLNQNLHLIDTNGGEQINIDHNESETVYPLRLGVGIERRFTEDWSIVVDYQYIQYQDIDSSAHGSTVVPDSIPVDLDLYIEGKDITRQVVTIGFNYYL